MSSYSRLDGEGSIHSSTGTYRDESSIGSARNSFSGMLHGLISSFGKMLETFRRSFKSLKDCPRELYINFCLKFLESYGYFALSQILVVYVHTEFGATDMQAGTIYGAWGACITFWGLTCSWMNDNLGVRKSLLIGFSIQAVCSVILATATSITSIYIILFCIMPIGTSMGIPMLTVGIKRYTNHVNRGFAFGLYYSVMNMAAFVCGPVIDGLNIGLKGGATVFGSHWTGNRLIILTTTATYSLSWIVTYLFLREIRVEQLLPEIHAGVVDADDTSLDTFGTPSTSSSSSRCSSNSSILNDAPLSDTRFEGSIPTRHAKSIDGCQYDACTDVSVCCDSSNLEAAYSSSNQKLLSEDGSIDDRGTNPLHTMAAIELTSSYGGKETYSNGKVATPPCVDNPTTCSTSTTAAATGLHDDDSRATSRATTTAAATEEYEVQSESLWVICGDLVYSATFWRYAVLTVFLINLRTIFRHLDATLPTYLIRCFGPNYPKGMIYSINPFMIIWLTPVVSALTSQYAHYDMIKYGGYVSAISPFFMVIDTATWSVVMFVVVLSLGESIWSPRTYDYTMTVAPEGREASFSALASAPLFAAQVPVGLLSGYLISTYLSEDNPHPDGQRLWLIIGLVTMTSPILITVFERWVREPERTRTSSRYPEAAGTSFRTVARDEHPVSLEEGGWTEHTASLEAQRIDRQQAHLYSEVGVSGTNVFTIADDDDDDDEDDLEPSDKYSHT